MSDEPTTGGEATAPLEIALLADHPDLIPAVAEIRWREWGGVPERAELDWWVDVTAREAGREGLPVTLVAIEPSAEAAGAVGLGRFDPEERRDRSPWVLGMIVRPGRRGTGVGRLLLESLSRWAAEHGYQRLWVATGDPAVSFYRSWGWTMAETFDRPAERIAILCTGLRRAAIDCEHDSMDKTDQQAATDRQIAEAMAAEHESLSPECRADADRFGELLAPDFHEFGASGGELGYEGTAALVAAATDLDTEPIKVENMRGWLLADGLVMLKYTSENRGRRSNRTSLWRRGAAGRWQIFHHQGTLAAR